MRVAEDGAGRRAALREARDVLHRGGLVAFPTETVYGLGANALDASAVQRIYEAKGRPAINPLIVHVATVDAARALAAEWTDLAEKLAREFWPGPLTLVVCKRDVIPEIVTAGGDTVGLRMPAHPVALALLTEAQLPVAAPSANLANQVSPTTAAHVIAGLGDRVDLILDGGPTTVGIESTVVDTTSGMPRILRPGMVTRDDLARVAGVAELASQEPGRVLQSPGMLGKHYSPRARVMLVGAAGLDEAIRRARASGKRIGVMAFHPVTADFSIRMPDTPAEYARKLYAGLHAMDDARCALILVERPPPGDPWAAIADRLERAAR